jgi:hypothetical protein
MIHESIQELETSLKLIQRQSNGFSYRDRMYSLDQSQIQQYGKPFAEAQALTNLLYSEAYARKRSAPNVSLNVPEATPAYLQQQHLFIEQLSAHNMTTIRRDEGWTIQTVYPQGQLGVHKSGTTVTLQAGEFELPGGTLQPVANMPVARIFPKENRTLQAAFYYVYGEAGFDYAPTVWRFYWNIGPEGSAKLIESLTRRLNQYRVPFLFKCLNHPALYNRRDAAVLYLQKRYVDMIEEILPAIIADVKTYLQDDVPLFSYTLAPGVGFAESPANGDSFGLTRMRVVSAGLIKALDQQYKQPEQQLSEILAAFAQEGIKPQMPYLNEGSTMVLKPMNA